MSGPLRFGYADSAEGQIHYAVQGHGMPLVLLPGSARSYRQFLPLLPLLADRYRLIAVDTLGYGASAEMPAGGSMETIARGVVAVLDALDVPPAHVFGIHTGPQPDPGPG
jgi:pimeloyl-ACP methyl ester carboxylesterase